MKYVKRGTLHDSMVQQPQVHRGCAGASCPGVAPGRRTPASDPGVGPGRRARASDPGVGPGRRAQASRLGVGPGLRARASRPGVGLGRRSRASDPGIRPGRRARASDLGVGPLGNLSTMYHWVVYNAYTCGVVQRITCVNCVLCKGLPVQRIYLCIYTLCKLCMPHNSLCKVYTGTSHPYVLHNLPVVH